MKPIPPRRAFEITVTVGADSWEEATIALRDVGFHIEDHGPDCNSVSGSPSSFHRVEVYRDPTMTHDRYHEELKAYLAARRAETP